MMCIQTIYILMQTSFFFIKKIFMGYLLSVDYFQKLHNVMSNGDYTLYMPVMFAALHHYSARNRLGGRHKHGASIVDCDGLESDNHDKLIFDMTSVSNMDIASLCT